MSYASSAIKRLGNEHRHLQKPENRVRDFFAAPLEDNIFEWHFTLRGPAGDDASLPYKDGLYHGALLFSRSYPLEPPDMVFFTRSGRFAVHEKICSTISSYHKELWQPTYDVALTLTALRHFMGQEGEFGVGAFPKDMVALETKRAWAQETWSFHCAVCGRSTRDVWEEEMQMYPEVSAEQAAQVPKLPQPSPAAGTPAGDETHNAGAASAAATASSTHQGDRGAPPPPTETVREEEIEQSADAGVPVVTALMPDSRGNSAEIPTVLGSSAAGAVSADTPSMPTSRWGDPPLDDAEHRTDKAAPPSPPMLAGAEAAMITAPPTAGADPLPSPLLPSTPPPRPAPPMQRVTLQVYNIRVDLSLRLLDRIIAVSFILVVSILMRRGVAALFLG